jgi:transcriptional regulator with XRE-family HTH domain
MVSAAQVRAARGLLNWSQGELAARARVVRRTLVAFETERRQPREQTLAGIQRALEDAGIELACT